MIRSTHRRGRHKVFIGMAPGVGKTCRMLQEGREALREGTDVVIGVVETHGRAETEALVHGLEAIPRRPVDYHGRALPEMDIDAILARHPQLVLVDELAHTNAVLRRYGAKTPLALLRGGFFGRRRSNRSGAFDASRAPRNRARKGRNQIKKNMGTGCLKRAKRTANSPKPGRSPTR